LFSRDTFDLSHFSSNLLCEEELNLLRKFWERNLQSVAQPEHRSQRWALNATLEQTDIRPIEIAIEAKLFLRQSRLLTQLSQSLTECLLGSRIGLDMPAAFFHWQVYRAIL
jgi:hypothetical protein